MGRKGFSLAEAVMAVAILGLVGLALGSAMRYLMRSHVRAQAQADLNEDAQKIVHDISFTIGKAGDGVPNTKTPVGLTIFSAIASTDSPSITFFHEDVENTDNPQMTPNDLWLRYSLLDGKLLRETFRTGSWTTIDPSVRIDSRTLTISDGTRITALQFNYYRSGSAGSVTPVMDTDPYTASYVRLHLELAKAGATLSRDAWIPLTNVLNARQLP